MARDALAGAGDTPLSADILRLLLESSQDALYAVGLHPVRLLYATPAFARGLGLPGDFLEQGYDVAAFLSSVHPDDRERVEGIMRAIAASRADADLPENPATYRLRTPQGGWRVIQDHYRVLRGPDGAAQTLLGNARAACGQDNGRQSLADNQARFLLLAENSRDLFFSMRFPGGHFDYLSPSYTEVTGFTPEEHYADPSIMFRVIAPEWRGQVSRWLEQISRGEVEESYEYQIVDRFGRLRWLHQRQVLTPGPDGQGLLLQGVATDVTELRMAQQALQENEARFRSLAENSRDIFFTMRLPEGRYEYINSRVTEIHGLTPQDFYDDPQAFTRILAPAWREQLPAWMDEIKQGRLREKYEFEVVDKDGRLRWIEERLVLVPAPDGQGMLLQGVASDHTEDHDSREALRQSEAHFRQLIEAWPEQVMLSVNLTRGRHEYVSPSMERVMGYAPQEFYDDPGLGLRMVAPQWQDQAREWLAQIGQGVLQPAYEFELVHKNGEHRFIHQVGALQPRAPGQDLVVQFTFRDITEERRASEALRQSEARYRELAESWTDQVIMRIDLDTGRPEYVSPSMERLFGHTPESVLASPPEHILAPGWGEQLGQWLEENRQGTLRPEYQYEILDTRGGRRWVSARGTLLRDGQGRPRTLQLSLSDITERKRLEEELRTSRAFLDCIIEQSPVSMWISDENGTLIRSNQALRRLFQVTEEEVAGRFNIFADNQALELGLMPQIRRVYDEGGTTRFMLPYDTRRIAGLELSRSSSAYLDVTISAVQDATGKTTNLIVQHQDISEHKRTEEELRTSKAFLDCIIEQSPMSMWISDEHGTLIRTNQALRDRLRITDADVVGKFNIFADNQALEQGFMPLIRRVYDEGGTERFTLAYDTGAVHGLDLSQPTQAILDFTISAVQDGQGRTTNLIIQHLDISEHTRMEAELSASERKYRSLHENMRDGFAAVDQHGFIIEHNKAFREMLGYTEDEILALTYKDITPQRWHQAESRIVAEQVYTRGYSEVFEKEYIRKDGSVLPVSLRIYRDNDSAQQRPGLWAIVRDITDSRRAMQALRESEERFRELVEGTQSLITQVDGSTGQFTYVNPMVRTLLGLEPEYFVGRLAWEIIHPDDRESSATAYRGWVQRRLAHTTHENRLVPASGEVRHVSWSIHFQYGTDGRVTLIDSIARDITELKRSEEALRKNEALLGAMLRNLPFDFWARDLSQQVILQSEESIRLWGDLTKRSLTDERFDESTLELWRANNRRALAGQIVSEECAYIVKNGELREFHNIVAPIRDGEDILGLIGVNIDITERKRSEVALRESEERFRLIVQTASEGIWTIDAERRATFVNAAMAKMLGYTVQEMLEADSETFIFPEDSEIQTWRLEQRRAGLGEVYERRFRRKDGTAMWALASAKPLVDKNGNYAGAFGMFMDITERKLAEAALRESNARYALLADNVVDVIWTTDADLRWTYLSPSAERLSGLPLARLMSMDFEELFTQDSIAVIAGLMVRRQAANAPGAKDEAYRAEMEIRRADGSLVPLEVLVRPMRGPGGEITGYCGTSRDITERRIVEQALRESEERYRQLAESWTEHVILRINLRTMRHEYVSPSVERLFGYTPEQYLQGDPAVIGAVAPEWRGQVAQWAQEAAAGVLQPEYEYEVYDAWGQRRWVYQRGALLRDAAGAPIAVQFMLSDITENKRMEAALTLIQERYDLALRGANDGIWDWDVLRGEVYYSDRWKEIIGYAPEELRHDVEEWTSRIHPDDFDLVMAENMRCVSGQVPIFQVEYRLRHKDGHYRWIFGRGAALANASGRVVRVAGAHTDITARKQAEDALYKSERLSRKLLESMHEGVWAVDADRRTIFVNDRLCAMLGYDAEEFKRMVPTDVLEWPQRSLPEGHLAGLESGITSATDFVLVRKDGTRFPAHVVSSPIVEEQGRFEGLVCGVVDLTERARMEHELRRNQARFEALYELSRLSPATEQQLAAFTLREAIRLTDSAAGVLFFASEDGATLEPKAWETGPFITTGQIPAFPASGQLPWALVAQNGLPLKINDYSQSAHLVPPGHPEVKRFLGVPAVDGTLTAAVLCLTGKDEHYTAEDTLQTTLLLDGMWREVRTRRDEERIRASLKEKDALLHEVHHRVKNNLQVISSLMDMAGRRLGNPEARQSLVELRGKVQAMSLIHAQLHGFSQGGGIGLERFVRALFNQLREVYSGGLCLSLVVELSTLALGLDQAVPLGLALNEALTNVFKHASTEARPGRVAIRAGQDNTGKVYILVRDDGPGLPPDLNPGQAQSLGLKLMHGLVRHQLGGQLEVHNCLPPERSGVEVCICFRPNIAR